MTLLLAGSLSLGCAAETIDDSQTEPEPDPSSCPAEAWSGMFELGTGEACFQGITEGQSMSLIAGPQGGYHMWFAFRCVDCAGSSRLIRFGVRDGEAEIGEPSERMLRPDAVGDYGELAGIQAYMPGDSWTEESPAYLGKNLTMWAEMSVAGETFLDEVDVMVDGVDYWSPPCDDPNGFCN